MTRNSALTVSESEGFAEFLAGCGVSLAFTTYQAGKIVLVGVNSSGRTSVFERSFPRAMGLASIDDQLWLATLYQLWRFENFLEPGQWHEGYDAVFVPAQAYTTGEIDIHDIGAGPDGCPQFVATRMNCLATLRRGASFAALWTPPFVDALVPEDRCHLNGAAFDGGSVRYVTCLARTNLPRGWSDQRRTGGVVLAVPSGDVVLADLSMPHSPRLHAGRLWVIDSGTGRFGYVDHACGSFETVCALPGFGRGLCFVRDHAIIGLSGPRTDRTFDGLVLNEQLRSSGEDAECGLVVVSLRTGDIVHRLRLEGAIQELYDVAVLPRVTRPMALGLKGDAIRYALRPFDGRARPLDQSGPATEAVQG